MPEYSDIQELIRSGDLVRAEGMLTHQLQSRPGEATLHRLMGLVAAGRGDKARAIESLAHATRLSPSNAQFHCELGRAFANNGDLRQALGHFERAANLDPGWLDGWFFLGITLSRLQRHLDAITPLRRAFDLAPSRKEVVTALAEAEFEAGHPADALSLWRTIASLEPDNEHALLRVGETLSRIGFHEEALATYENALGRHPESARLTMALAQAREDNGDRENAHAAYMRALQLKPGWAFPISGLLGLLRGQSPPELISQAIELQGRQDLTDQDRALIGYELGKVQDSLGQHQAAIASWNDANAARRRRSGALDRGALACKADSIVGSFTREFFQRVAAWGSEDERPVFVVGMPRSGTTLTEQIIAMHPLAHGCGELPDIPLIANAILAKSSIAGSWSGLMESIDEGLLKSEASRYLAAAGLHAPAGSKRLVDKAPLNFFHAGLIAAMFPRSRILWCRRDPRDIAISIFSENFSPDATFATDLADIGHYIGVQHRLMKHWQSVLPVPILEVRYESLVSHFEPEARRLIAFTGLDWHPGCLDFHANRKGVQTPSRWQVRQPVHSRSVGRWRQHAGNLTALMDELGSQHFD